MKIVSPLSNINELKSIIPTGVSEIYFGILPGSWLKGYSNMISMNRREFASSNISTLEDINCICKKCKENNVKTNLTLNAHFYIDDQLRYIKKLLNKMQVDNIIVTDIGLIRFITKEYPHFKLHLSTGGTAFNIETIKFYRELGIRRIIFPRHIQIKEVKQIKNKLKDIEIELFILNQGCINIDGYCYYLHGLKEFSNKSRYKINNTFIKRIFNILPEYFKNRIRFYEEVDQGNMCLQTYKIKNLSDNKSKITSYNPHIYSGIKCGVCSLYKLRNMKNLFLKIVGREHLLEKKLKDINYLKEVLKNINKTEKEYIEICKELHYHTFNERCNPDKCYYPI